MRLFLGAFGDPGHTFPVVALGREMVQRGHSVTLQTWQRWRQEVEAEGMKFEAAPEYDVFPTLGRYLRPYEAVVRAAADTVPLVQKLRPDVVVADILTLAPAMAGEIEGVPVATIIPHGHPGSAPGFPPYSLGARLPRTALGGRLWDTLARPLETGLRRGREELNDTRAKLGLGPVAELHGGISRDLCLVGTFPQLEYPRAWPPSVHVVGPLMWEMPFEEVELPPGDDPLVLVAPSTVHDPDHRLLRAAVEGLADEPVRVIATTNRRPVTGRLLRAPPNARVVDWISYGRTMPLCDVVLCHGGHGTMARALTSGCRVVVAPVAGDQNENAARLDWAGAGVRVPWRFVSERTVRLATRRALADDSIAARTAELAAWAAANPGPATAADRLEAFVRDRVASTA